MAVVNYLPRPGESEARKLMRAQVLTHLRKIKRPISPVRLTKDLGLNVYDNSSAVNYALHQLVALKKVRRVEGKRVMDTKYQAVR